MPTVQTVTVKSAGGDYTSLSAAEAGEQTNLVTGDVQLDIECYAFDDSNTSQFTIDGWTTDATRYIRIFTPSAERHNGKWDTSAYRWRLTSGWGGFFSGFVCNEDYTRFEGLQFAFESVTGDFRGGVDASGSSGCRFSHNLVRWVPTSGSSATGVLLGHSNASIYAWNNVIWTEGGVPTSSTGLMKSTANFNHNAYFYNNTVHGWATGTSSPNGNAALAKNNLVNGCTTCYSGSFDASSTNNLSEDATSPNAGLRNLAVSFVDEANYDFHLASGDTAAKDAGADLSADANLAFSTDIDGETRSGTWDIGADEVTAAPPAGGRTIVIGSNLTYSILVCGPVQ